MLVFYFECKLFYVIKGLLDESGYLFCSGVFFSLNKSYEIKGVIYIFF